MALDYKAIGRRIRFDRMSRQLTHEKLSELTDISREHISHIESGSTKLSLTAIVNIANALDTSVDYFLYDNVKASYSNYDLDLKLLLEHCTPREREIVYESVKSLIAAMKK